MKYFLITSLAKSGTTWVQRICHAHPEMHCRAEDQFTKFWGRVNDLTEDYNDLVMQRDRERDQQGIDALNKDDATKLFFSMVKIAMDKAPPGTACTGIKDLVLSNRGFLEYLPNAHIINVIRDPRDVAISAKAHARRVDGTETELDDAFAADVYLLWLRHLRMVDSARRRFPRQVHDIRFEDLVADFPMAVGALLSFLGVDASRETIEHLRRETDFKRLSGGRAPGEADPNSYFRKGIAGDWRQTLTASQIAFAEQQCGEQLEAHGYDRR